MSARGEVRFERVSKRYGDVTAVREVSFTIPKGTLATLLGPSGCGKTTTLRMLAGLELPSEGRIFLGEREVTRLPAHERDVAMVFQSYALFPHLQVLDNVGYGLRVQGRPAKEVQERARAALATVGLTGLEQRWPGEMSGGQQQRVALARALVLEPEVLLFDEPLSNLDARLRRKMREEIRELQQRLGLTAVYVTHDQDEALSISDRIIVMDRSVVVQEGTPRELYEAPRTRFVADFMGESNVVDGALRRAPGGGELAEVALGPVTLRLPHRGAPDGPVKVAIRPHALEPAGAGDAALPATVARVVYLGDHLELELDSPLGRLFMVAPVREGGWAKGDAVRLRLVADAGGVAVLPG